MHCGNPKQNIQNTEWREKEREKKIPRETYA
jgi:hypothetical protein